MNAVKESTPANTPASSRNHSRTPQHFKRPTTRTRIYNALLSAGGGWVPAPALSTIACAYTRCLFELREMGCVIENKTEYVGGVRHGFYRLLRRDPERSAHVEMWKSFAEQSSLDLGPKPVTGWSGDPETEGRRA